MLGILAYNHNAAFSLNDLALLADFLYGWLYLHWKGHVESGESEEETALREVFEEVGIKLTLDRNFRIEDEYTISYQDEILKRVVYFLGYYSDQIIRSLETELEDAILVDYQTAIALFQHESNRWILSEADRFIREKGI